jgi:Putative metallopeptidase
MRVFCFDFDVSARRDTACRAARPYEPNDFEERIQAAASALGSSVRLRDASPQYRQILAEFVSGNLLFVLCYGVAHAAMTQMGLPVLGKAEGAADFFATLRMIKVGSAGTGRLRRLRERAGWCETA